jgi:hypothetical protein
VHRIDQRQPFADLLSASACSTWEVMLMKARRPGTSNQSSLRWEIMDSSCLSVEWAAFFGGRIETRIPILHRPAVSIHPARVYRAGLLDQLL